MTYPVAIAYASVAYRIMKYENNDQTEEYFDIILGILFDFLSPIEIQKIYRENTLLTTSDIILKSDE